MSIFHNSEEFKINDTAEISFLRRKYVESLDTVLSICLSFVMEFDFDGLLKTMELVPGNVKKLASNSELIQLIDKMIKKLPVKLSKIYI